MTTVSKEVWKRYITSEKGKATLEKYHHSEKFKATQDKYKKSDKAKANRKAHPEIYRVGIEKLLTNNVCNILQEHAEKVGDDPERLTTEFICKMARIKTQ